MLLACYISCKHLQEPENSWVTPIPHSINYVQEYSGSSPHSIPPYPHEERVKGKLTKATKEYL